MSDRDFAHCQCPRDDDGEIEVWFLERPNGNGDVVRYYQKLYNPNCPKHGWKFEQGLAPVV